MEIQLNGEAKAQLMLMRRGKEVKRGRGKLCHNRLWRHSSQFLILIAIFILCEHLDIKQTESYAST
jgi:hypothetical protein